MPRSGKGSAFERKLSEDLSKWASRGGAEDWYWRASQSGGRATTRRKKGKSTSGHCGDIAATCSEGEFLTKLITIEAKKGYNADTVFNLFDRPKACGKTWFNWFGQATAAAENAGTPYWCVIHRRDHRDPIIALPEGLVKDLIGIGCSFPTGLYLGHATVLRLETFFESVDPQDIRTLLARSKQR